MRIVIYIMGLLLWLGCSQRLVGGPNTIAIPSVNVSLLYLTSNIEWTCRQGVFKIDNRLDGDLVVAASWIAALDGTNWTFLHHPFNEFKQTRWNILSDPAAWPWLGDSDFHLPGGQSVIFEAWVPDKGGPYQFVINSRMHANSRTNAEIHSPPFRVSDGPPMTTNDFIIVPTYSSDVRSLVNLVNQITNADRIVLTNRFSDLDGFSDSIAGDKVSKIVHAISAAKRMNFPSLCAWDWQFQFYAGTNYLASVNFQGGSFLIGTEEYYEESGVLDKFYEDLSNQVETRLIQRERK